MKNMNKEQLVQHLEYNVFDDIKYLIKEGVDIPETVIPEVLRELAHRLLDNAKEREDKEKS